MHMKPGAGRPGVSDPAAFIGRKKYGKKKMSDWSAKARKKKKHPMNPTQMAIHSFGK